MLKRTGAFLVVLSLIFALFPSMASALDEVPTDAKSYILVEASTGSVLAEKDADKPLPCANVIKTMSLLLFMEAAEQGKLNLSDKVTVSQTAAGKGGTSVFLDADKSYRVGDLLKAVIVCSANDACVALAEYLSGSEEEFVKRMNERAAELGMKGTKFINSTGLDAEGQVTTARDMALAGCALAKYPLFFKYSTIWMQDFQHEGGRTTQMVNTNRLVRFYEGCDGMRTGSSPSAGYCIVASAKRSGGRFIFVCLGSKSSDTRFDSAKKAFDLAFSNYTSKTIVKKDTVVKTAIPVAKGDKDMVDAYAANDLNVLIPKDKESSVEKKVTVAEELNAPLEAGQIIGKLTVTLDGNELGCVDLICKQPVQELEFLSSLHKIMNAWLY